MTYIQTQINVLHGQTLTQAAAEALFRLDGSYQETVLKGPLVIPSQLRSVINLAVLIY